MSCFPLNEVYPDFWCIICKTGAPSSFWRLFFIYQYFGWLIDTAEILFLAKFTFVCERCSLHSSEHRLLVSGALADKKRLCPDRQGWYSHFSWAPTSVIGFEKRDWWRTSLSVAWCFSPQGFSACVPRPSVSLASHEPACVSSEPLCTPGEVAAAGAHQSFWSLSWLTSFFFFFFFFLPCCADAPAGKPVQGCCVGAQGRHLIFHLKNGAAVLMHNFTTVKGFALFIESSGLSTWFKLVSHKAST